MGFAYEKRIGVDIEKINLSFQYQCISDKFLSKKEIEDINKSKNIEKFYNLWTAMAYIYACIDTGIMVSLLTYIAEAEEVGSCSIGEMDYKKIKPLFPLTSNMSFLHSMEFGIKK